DGEDNIIVYGRFRGRELTVDSFTVRNAETVYLQGDFGQDEIYLLKVNPNGQAISLKSIQGKDVELSSKNDLTCDKDNNIYLGGLMGSDTVVFNERITLYKDRRQLNYYDIFYAKYDKEGNCTWARSIINGNDAIDDMSIHVLPTGHLIVSGNFSNQDLYAGNTTVGSKGKGDCFVLLTGNNGEIITGFSYGGDQQEYDGQLSSDGRNLYILSSFGSSELEFENVIVKNDTINGSLDCLLLKYSIDSLTSASDLPEDQIEIGVYPNPANEMVRLQLPEDISQGLLYYNLYDMGGKFMSSGLLKSNQTILSVQSLQAGYYIIRGASLNGKKFVGRFVKTE
nr:T9SS type A sorting domain-containing protein [Saprospiraceae bacterium]